MPTCGAASPTPGAATIVSRMSVASVASRASNSTTGNAGDRRTGSPNLRRANEWTLARFRDYGLEAHLEQWNFGGTWTRGPMWVRMTAPRVHEVLAASWAWAPGTNGKTVRGPVVRIDASVPESRAFGTS